MLLLRPQLCSVNRGKLYHYPVPGIFRPSQSMCALDRAPCDGRHQGLLRPLCAPLPNRHLSLSEAGRVVYRPELHLAPERCDEVSCDDTESCPVFRVCKCWFWKGQSCLFH